MLTNKLFEKLSIAEILSILFIVSVGLSMLYKYGFYTELGIGWFTKTLSPQELLISSINYVLSSLVGIVLGVLSIHYADKYLEVVMTVMVVISLIFLISINYNSGIFKGEIYLMLNFAACMLYLTKINRGVVDSKGILLIDKEWQDRSFFEKTTPALFASIFILLPLYMVYTQGKSDAKDISNPDYKINYIKLKSDKTIWILIEMRGDKVLMMKDGEKREFKIVEYKEIESYKLN